MNDDDRLSNEEIKAKNNKFLDELFTKSISMISKVYKEHTASLSCMAFDNAMANRLEEFYTADTQTSKEFPVDKFKPETMSRQSKRRRVFGNLLKTRDLDKMSRLK